MGRFDTPSFFSEELNLENQRLLILFEFDNDMIQRQQSLSMI